MNHVEPVIPEADPSCAAGSGSALVAAAFLALFKGGRTIDRLSSVFLLFALATALAGVLLDAFGSTRLYPALLLGSCLAGLVEKYYALRVAVDVEIFETFVRRFPDAGIAAERELARAMQEFKAASPALFVSREAGETHETLVRKCQRTAAIFYRQAAWAAAQVVAVLAVPALAWLR